MFGRPYLSSMLIISHTHTHTHTWMLTCRLQVQNWDLVFQMNLFFLRGEPLPKFFRNAYFGFLFPMRGLTGAQRSSFPRYSRLKFEIFLQTLSHFSITIFKISGMLCIYVRSEREVINITKHDIPEISFSGDKKR